MNYDRLTDFDKHVLAHNNSAQYFADPYADKNETEKYDFSSHKNDFLVEREEDNYDRYLLNELRRTAPGKPVMTREQFLASEASSYSAPYDWSEQRPYSSYVSNDFSIERSMQQTVTPAQARARVRKSRFTSLFNKIKLPKLTKVGKIVLSVYVILLLAVASILIVANTSMTDVDFHESANASMAIAEEENPSTIRSMSVKEDDQEEHDDWFDKLCDAMNK